MTRQFNAVLDRLGRVQLSVRQANQQTGQLNPAAGAAITVDRLLRPRPHRPETTADDGSALDHPAERHLHRDRQRYRRAGDRLDRPGRFNQTVNAAMTLSSRSGPFVGRITTTGMTARPIGADGAAVTVTGTVDYNGSTAVAGTAAVTTDSHGCYAILPADYTLADRRRR